MVGMPSILTRQAVQFQLDPRPQPDTQVPLIGADALELEPAERVVVYLAPLAAVAAPLERARLARAVSEAALTMAQMAALEANRTRSWAEIGEALGISRNGAHR
jgi:hypothetical protein